MALCTNLTQSVGRYIAYKCLQKRKLRGFVSLLSLDDLGMRNRIRGSFKCRARASALPNVLAPNFVVKTDVQALVAFDRIPQIPPP